MIDGYFGKYLDVSLSDGKISDYHVPNEWHRKFLGGRGIAARILLEELEPGVDPLGPDNVFVVATGPLQGLNVPGAGRHLIMSKSPKTNAVSGSYVGGYFGQELGRSGYDGIIVRGASPDPVYLLLKGGKGEIKDGSHLWGLDTADTENAIKEEGKDVRVASIGRAGENLVKFSCVIHDRNRAAGRPGFGAVLGAKNLKAIGVEGFRSKDVFDEEKLKEVRGEFARTLAQTKADSLGKYGTAGGVMALDELGILPTKNFQKGSFAGAEEISGERMYDSILVEQDSCSACPVRCKRVVQAEFDGEKVRPEYGGPEYETVAAFGSLCMNSDLNAVALANQKCNQHGLDTISTGVSIAFAMEASERGLIEEEIAWGDPQKVVQLVDMIADREGFGDRLADGIDRLADDLGVDFAMEIKGQEIPMHEPRGKKGLGISYSTTPRGANHMEGIHDTQLEDGPLAPELGVEEPTDRFDLDGKAGLMKKFEDLRSFNNSLVMCAFTTDMVGEDYSFVTVRKLVNAVTGREIDADKMMRIGERNYLALRVLSAREGHTTWEDRLPKRFEQPLENGPSSGHAIPEEDLEVVLEDYYRLRGYEGYGPGDEKLENLEMDGFIDVIEREGTD